MRNVFNETEKHLKKCLKYNKTLKYSAGLVLSFLVTGLFVQADEGDTIEKNIKSLEKDIKKQRKENKKKLKVSNNELFRLEMQGDQVVKSPWESYQFSVVGNYVNNKKEGKRLHYGDVTTKEDGVRGEFGETLKSMELTGKKKGKSGTSGWVTKTNTANESTISAWNNNMVEYDHTAKLRIFPNVPVPEILAPIAPVVSLPNITDPNTPVAPNVRIDPLTIGSISVNPIAPITPPSAPTLTISTPGTVSVATVNLNVSVTPPVITAPNFQPIVAPTVGISTPTLTVNPIIPPVITPPTPGVPQAPTVVAPDWQPLAAPGRTWLGRGNLNIDGRINTAGGTYRYSMPMHNKFDRTPTANYTGSGEYYYHSGSDTPLFNNLLPRSGTYVAIAGSIADTGKIVTINGLTTASGQSLSGWNGSNVVNAVTLGAYTGYTDYVTCNIYQLNICNDDPLRGAVVDNRTPEERATDGNIYAFSSNYAMHQEHRTLFLLGGVTNPLFENITAHFGSSSGLTGAAAAQKVSFLSLYNTSGKTTVKNSALHMYGKSFIATDIPNNKVNEIEFQNTSINIYGNDNTLFQIQSSSGGHADYNKIGQTTINMSSDIAVDKRRTVLAYVVNPNTMAGNNSAIPTGGTGRLWRKFYTYTPAYGGFEFRNTGIVDMYGAHNAGVILKLSVLSNGSTVPTYNPVNKIETEIKFGGDENVGLYLAADWNNPVANGMFVGTSNLKFSFGEKLTSAGATSQTVDGHQPASDGSTSKTERSVGVLAEGGQRNSLNVKELYPGTEKRDEYINFSVGNLTAGQIYTGDNTGNYTRSIQAGQDGLISGGVVVTSARVTPLILDNFKITFGKYSKDNIALVSRNGTVVDWSDSSGSIKDNAVEINAHGNEDSTAVGSTLAYAEGIWFNPRQRGLQNENYVWKGIAYGALTRQGGKYYVPEFRSEINITNNATVNSIKSVPFYAKDGGLIKTKAVTSNGYGTVVAMAFADRHKAPVLTGTEVTNDKEGKQIWTGNAEHTASGNPNQAGVKWNSEDGYYGPVITDANGIVISHSSILPKTEIIVDGVVTALKQGPRRDALGNIVAGTNVVNDNTGAVAVVNAGTNGASVWVKDNMNIKGLGAFAKGSGAEIHLDGAANNIYTGEKGALVATEGGVVKFDGGFIEHKRTYTDGIDNSHKNKLVIYADTGSKIQFNGTTNIEIADGVLFYGPKADYVGAVSTTAKYSGMSNVNVKLTDHGINIGSLVGAATPLALTLNTAGTGFDAAVKSNYSLNSFAANGKNFIADVKYATLNVGIDVNRDVAQTFNDLAMERVMTTLAPTNKITSTAGKGLAINSNADSNTNADSGYNINGELKITGTADKNTGAYVSYGQVNVGATGKIEIDKGVGIYGVNGSKLTNAGDIKVTSGTGNVGMVAFGRRVKADGTVETTLESFGKDANKAGNYVEVSNTKNIDISGTDSMGIFVSNNVNDVAAAQSTVKVSNSGSIKVGDRSIGINILGTHGGQLTLSTTSPTITNITVGAESYAISAHSSLITLAGDHVISLGKKSVGLNLSGSMSLTNPTGKTLTISSIFNDLLVTTAPSYGIGLYYDGITTSILTNTTNIALKGTTTAPEANKALIGLFVKGAEGNATPSGSRTTLSNTANILTSQNDIGIYASKTNITNTGTITVAKDAKGIYADESNLTTTDSNIVVSGEKGTGIYIKGATRKATINSGGATTKLAVTGDSGLGIYVDQAELEVAGKIELSNSAIATRKTGIYLEATKKANVLNTGSNITVGKDNIGAYLNNSYLTNKGTIDVEETTGTTNIGIYAQAKKVGGDDFKFANEGTLKVKGLKNIGVYAETDNGAANTGVINLSSGTITVESTATTGFTNNIPLGVYAKGKNINIEASSGTITAKPNTLGIYIDGKSTLGKTGNVFNTTFNLSSSLSGANELLGIGAYLSEGAESQAGTIKMTSTATASNGSGQKIRPIGLYYKAIASDLTNGSNLEILAGSQEMIGLYANGVQKLTTTGTTKLNVDSIGLYANDTVLENTGQIDIQGTTNGAYGIYLNATTAKTSKNTATINVNGAKSLGALVVGNAKLENTGEINSKLGTTIGVYTTDGGEVINKGTIKGSLAASSNLALMTKGGTITNNAAGTIESSYLGVYAEKGTGTTVVTESGELKINAGTGILAKDDSTSAASSVTVNLKGNVNSTANTITGVVGRDGTVVNLDGAANTSVVTLVNGSSAIVLDQKTVGTLKSVVNLKSGNIKVGDSSTAVYAENGIVNIASDYSSKGQLELGNQSIGIFLAKDADINPTGSIKIKSNATTGKAVGILYEGGLGSPIKVNGVGIEQTSDSKNLINIYGNKVKLTNTANLEVGTDGIGLYMTGSVTDKSELTNNAILNINGKSTDVGIGIYLANDTDLKNLGTIENTTTDTTLQGSENKKVGIYVSNNANNNISSSGNYTFNIAGGIGLYLNKAVDYSGTLRVNSGIHENTSGDKFRTIGVYAAASDNDFKTNIDVVGAGAVGLYQPGQTITYKGNLNISANSTDTDKGIGVYVGNGTFNLDPLASVTIGGTYNIGFYVTAGGNLNVGSGAITNTEGGIFSYVEGGNMTFTPGGSLNLNYANVIVAKGGSLTNQTTLTTGTTGLQATGKNVGVYSSVLNDTTGVINSNSLNAIAISGSDEAIVDNKGTINLTGNGSIAVYTDGAQGENSGAVNIGTNSVAYYAEDKDNKGHGLTVTNTATTTIGQGSTLLAVDKGGQLDYQAGPIVLGDKIGGALIGGVNMSNVQSSINFNNNDITVGKESVAVLLKEDGEINNTLRDLIIGELGVGIYGIDDTNVSSASTTGRTIKLDKGATGIYSTGAGTLNHDGIISSTSEKATGMASKSTAPSIGKLNNSGAIDLQAVSTIGMYGDQIDSITNTTGATIKVGDTATTSSVGIYSIKTNDVINEGTIEFGQLAVGIYAEDTLNIENKGTGIIGNSTIYKGTGIFAKNSTINNSGSIVLGDSSNGVYVENGVIRNTGDVTVGNTNGTALYGAGLSNVEHNAGTVAIGTKSVGIATDGGTVINRANIIGAEESLYMYSDSGEGINDTTMTLSKYSMGMYTKSGKMTNKGTIIVGESDTISNPRRFSVGMVTKAGEIVNESTIEVLNKSGVGMFATAETSTDPITGVITVLASGTATNKGTINVSGSNAYGMQGNNEANVVNEGTINVTGSKATGIAATSKAKVLNAASGVINVIGTNAVGIFVDAQATVDNQGIINVDGTGTTGIEIGSGGLLHNSGTIVTTNGAISQIGGGGTLQNIGSIDIDGPLATVNGIIIDNIGVINVNGLLEFQDNAVLKTNPDNPGTINVGSMSSEGNLLIDPGATQGNNNEMYHVQFVGGIGNVPDVTLSLISQSVSFLPGQFYDSSTGRYVITLTKVPYEFMLENTAGYELGVGLDQLYKSPTVTELDMFDKMDLIDDKEELAEVFDNELRGNVYADIQKRTKSINEAFDSSYDTLHSQGNTSKSSTKVMAIYSGEKTSNENMGIVDYKRYTVGAMYLKEIETMKYGQNYNFNAGITQSRFDFDNDSKEDVTSARLGIGYEQYLGDMSNFKIVTRADVTANRHNMKRKIHIKDEVYENKGNYFSGIVESKNQLRYEIPTRTESFKLGLIGSLSLGYGMYEGFKEKGDGVFLDIKKEDFFTLRPGVGLDTKYSYSTNNGSKFTLNAGVLYEYETLGQDKEGNRVKLADTTAGYYNLEKVKSEESIVKLNLGLGYEFANGLRLGIGAEKKLIDSDSYNYKAEISWVF